MTEVTSDEPVVRATDLPGAGLCARGGRVFAAQHGLSWPDFVERGLPLSFVESMGDGLANRVAAAARRRLGLPGRT